MKLFYTSRLKNPKGDPKVEKIQSGNNRLKAGLFFAALLLVTLTLLVSFGTPVKAVCIVKFLNATNLTAYWGQNVTVGINVTDTTVAAANSPAVGSVFKLDLVCANSTLCGTANQTSPGPFTGTTVAAGGGLGGFASITMPASQNPLYTSAAVGSGAPGAPLSPGNYYTVINFYAGGCVSGANLTEMGVNIKGYHPLLTVTNIINASTSDAGYGQAVNISFSYAYPNGAVLNTARHSPNFTVFNFSINSNIQNNYTAFTNGTGTKYRNITRDNGGPAVFSSHEARVAPLSLTTVSLNNSWNRDRIYVNITAVTDDGWYTAYANTTVNYINIQVNKSDGTPFTGQAFVWKLNAATKTSFRPAGWGLDNLQAPPFLPLTAGTFAINCYDSDSACISTPQTAPYSTSGSILGPGQTTGMMRSQLESGQLLLVAYDMGSSNMSDPFPVTPRTNANAINLTLNNSGSMAQFSVNTLSNTQGSATLTYMKIYDNNGLVYNLNLSTTDPFMSSVPLKLGTNYSIEIAGTEESGAAFATHNITYTPVFNGFGGAVIMVWNQTLPGGNPIQMATVRGQVLSQFAGARNITVYAEPRECHAGGPFVTVCIVNSTMTDSNGLFSMRVPLLPGMSNEYKFTAVDPRRTDTAGAAFSGPLTHYPTSDDNNGRYYRIEGTQLVVPPINMTYAGTISLNVGIGPNTFGIMTELSRLRNTAIGWVRDNFVSRMAMANAFDFLEDAAPITSITFPMDSPTNGSSTVNLFFWSFGMTGQPGPNNPPSIVSGDRNTTSVNWRSFSSVLGNTTTQGNLVLYVSRCNGGSVFNQQPQACPAPAALNPMGPDGGSYWNFWWNSKVIIYNAGNSSQPYQYLEGTEDSMFLSRGKIPLMPGLYQLEITSKQDWDKPLSQNRTIPFQITAGADTNLAVYMYSPGWDIRSPDFPYTMRRTGDNNITAAVFDFAYGGMLGSASKVNLTFQAVNTNGSAAMQAMPMNFTNITFQPGNKVVEMFNWTFVPSQYGIPAGKYIGLFRANLTNYSINPKNSQNMGGTCTSDATCGAGPGYYADIYVTNKLWEYQFIVSDFDVGTEMTKRTYVPGEMMKGTLYGFNRTQPAGSAGLNGTVATYIYNDAGRLINSTPTTWTLVNMLRYNMSYGIANLSIPAPATVGWYEILSIVNVTGGRGQGVLDGLNGTTFRGEALSDTWLKVSNFGFEDKYDKRSYATGDTVKLGITLTNGTTGTAISNAAITAFVDMDQTPMFAMTDSKGRASILLSKSGGWSYGGHNVRMTVNAFNSSGNNDVLKEEFFSWFNVGGIDVNFYPTKSKYAVTENVTVNVYSTSVSNANGFTLYVDGNDTQATWSQQGAGYFTANLVPQGQWTPGRHFMELRLGSGDKGTASFFGGFETSAVNLLIAMNGTDHIGGSTAGAVVKVVNSTNMLPVSNSLVTGNFYRQVAGSNKLLSTISIHTTANGTAVMNLSIPEGGYYLLEVLASGQRETATFRASGMSVLVQGNSTFNAGQTVQFNITSVAQSTVEATLWAYGEKITMPSGATRQAYNGIYGDYILNYTLPADTPAGTYTLDVKVTTNTSVIGFNTTAFTVTGPATYDIQLSSGKSTMEAYRTGETATLTATLRNGTSPATGVNMTFTIGGKTVTDTTKGTAVTNAAGMAVLSTTVPGVDDFYYAKVYVTNSPEVSAYASVVVASLNVTLVTVNGNTGVPTDRFPYSAGGVQSVVFNMTARTTAGTIVDFSDGATTGGLTITLFNKDNGEISQSFNTLIAPTRDGIYSLNTTLPNATGSYTFMGMVRANSSMGFATTMATLNTANLIMNVTTPAGIIANTTSFNVTVNVFDTAGTGKTGTVSVTIFSPTASNLPVYDSRNMQVTPDYNGVFNVNISGKNITYPGIYVVKAEFIGTDMKMSNVTLINVGAGTYPATLEVSLITSTTATITSNVPNATVYLMKESGGRTTTMALSLVPIGSSFYTTATGLTTGTNYFARLDSVNSTGVNTTMFRTS